MAPTLADVKMRVPAGAPVEFAGWPHNHMAVVEMPGPTASSFWAIRDDTGERVCLKWNGRRKEYELEVSLTKRVALTRRFLVVEYVMAEQRRAYRRWTDGDVVQLAYETWVRWYPASDFDFEMFHNRATRFTYGAPRVFR